MKLKTSLESLIQILKPNHLLIIFTGVTKQKVYIVEVVSQFQIKEKIRWHL